MTEEHEPTPQAGPASRQGVRRVPAAAWAVAIVLTVLAARSTWEQWQAYGRAVALENAGEVVEAVQEYRWTLRWYTPWGPVHGDAADALLAIADGHEKEDPKLALQALDGLRSGLLAARSFYQPRSATVELCNRRIPPLLVRLADRAGDRRDPAALLTRFQADYARRVGVPAWVSLAVSLGFVIWIAGLLLAFRHGFDRRGRWLPVGWRWLAASAFGFACWTLAMWLG